MTAEGPPLTKPAPKFMSYHEASRMFGLLIRAQRLLGQSVIDGSLDKEDSRKLEDLLDEIARLS